MLKNGKFTLLLTCSDQEWQYDSVTEIQWSRIAISECYWHLVVNNGHFTVLLTSSESRMAISHCYSHLSGQEWQFYIAADIWWLRKAISKNGNFNSATDILVGKNGNLTLLLISSCQEWQFHIATDIYCSRMPISRMAIWHLAITNGHFTVLMAYSG